MKVLIAGLGYIGTHLAKQLTSQGVHVWGLRRTEGAPAELESNEHFHALKADLTRPGQLKNIPSADIVVFSQAPRLTGDTYEMTYYESTRLLLEATPANSKTKIIFVSSTSVYAHCDGSWVDETTDLGLEHDNMESASRANVLVKTEKLVLGSGFPAQVFRLGGIYGPGRNRIRLLREGSMAGAFTNTFTNRIHRDDVVSGIRFLMEYGHWGEIYLGVDDEPTTQREFYAWLYGKIAKNIPDGRELSKQVQGKRCSNRKIKSLGFVFKYPTFREGYGELFRRDYP